MEKFGEKFGPIGEELLGAIHRKKAEIEPDYEDENPEITEEVIEDLKKMGKLQEKVEEKVEEKKEDWSEVKPKDIHKLAGALGKAIDEKAEKELAEKPWSVQQEKRYQKELEIAEKKKDNKMVEYWRAKLARLEIDKQFKNVREKIKKEKEEKRAGKIRNPAKFKWH